MTVSEGVRNIVDNAVKKSTWFGRACDNDYWTQYFENSVRFFKTMDYIACCV